jgi:hypothetical protein
MPNVTSLVREGGVMIMMIRHGPVPPGRRMFEVSAEETIELARMQDLHPVLNRRTESRQEANRVAGITWTNLAFVKARKRSMSPSWPGIAVRRTASLLLAYVPAIHVFLAAIPLRRGRPASQTSLRSLRKADCYGRA